MDIGLACESILGHQLARAIIDSLGIHWAVVAAMAQAMDYDNPHAIAALRKWVADQKAMDAALEADGEKLRHLTGDDHGPFDA